MFSIIIGKVLTLMFFFKIGLTYTFLSGLHARFSRVFVVACENNCAHGEVIPKSFLVPKLS